jgi:hypothetical protein
MAVRRYGPTRGAGTRLEEQDGDKTITPSALGWTGYAAIFEKGPVGELVLLSSKTEFVKKMGGIITDGLGPDCALDYYTLANGAGGLALVRVTDGNELPAEATLYARRFGASGFVTMGKIKAANGGRWGGKAKRFSKLLDNISGLTNTTLQIGTADASSFKKDEWKGGYIKLTAVPNKRYPIIGNSATGLITIAGDQTMLTDAGVSPNLRYYLVLENESKGLAVRIDDGEENPDTEFSLEVFLDGVSVRKFGNLSVDVLSPRYWVNLINNDTGNDYVFAQDLWTGAATADVRPSNYYGKITTVTDSLLTATIHSFVINSPGGGNPTMTLGTTTDDMVEQTITVTMSSPTAGTAVSDKFGALGAVTTGSAFASPNEWTPGFTVTAGTSALTAADTLVIVYRPFMASALVGGSLYPDKVNAKRTKYRVTANTHKTITVASGSDMTSVGAMNDFFLVTFPIELSGGRDGNSLVGDSTYENQAWDTATSPFNDLEGKNLGLVKLATPGVTSVSVQKAGVAYAQAKNQQYRVEIPVNIVTESAAFDYINETIGRNDYLVTSFPSYGEVAHPDPASAREGKRKTVSLTGMIHGREARIAADWDGYHKAAAGVDATLPRLLTIPTGDRKLDQELLNPAGVNVIVKKGGNFVLWGDRVAHVDPAWKFKHQRELMSHYEHVLQENFDFIVFTINDTDSDAQAVTAFTQYFLPEWVKRALRGKDFPTACSIKVDSELNTDASREEGDKIAEVALRFAATTERFIIRIGKAGIFESVA